MAAGSTRLGGHGALAAGLPYDSMTWQRCLRGVQQAAEHVHICSRPQSVCTSALAACCRVPVLDPPPVSPSALPGRPAGLQCLAVSARPASSSAAWPS
jgi:hypothetical protein